MLHFARICQTTLCEVHNIQPDLRLTSDGYNSFGCFGVEKARALRSCSDLIRFNVRVQVKSCTSCQGAYASRPVISHTGYTKDNVCLFSTVQALNLVMISCLLHAVLSLLCHAVPETDRPPSILSVIFSRFMSALWSLCAAVYRTRK